MSQLPNIRLLAAATVLVTTTACAAYATSSLAGNADKGRQLFIANSCSACHGVTEQDTSMVGPSLFGIIGRKAGTAPSLLGASRNLKEYGVTWNTETLFEFLADPDAKVPGTPMTGMIVDPQERADVIAYLATLSE